MTPLPINEAGSLSGTKREFYRGAFSSCSWQLPREGVSLYKRELAPSMSCGLKQQAYASGTDGKRCPFIMIGKSLQTSDRRNVYYLAETFASSLYRWGIRATWGAKFQRSAKRKSFLYRQKQTNKQKKKTPTLFFRQTQYKEKDNFH